MLSQRSDAQLVAAAQGGDRQAFGKLLDRHQAMVMRIALRMVRRPDVARELAQEAMLEAFLCVRSLRNPDRFQNWLYGIALNVCRNYLRRQRMDLFSLETMLGGLAFDTLPFTSAEPGPQQVAETRELHELVLAAVNELSAKNRAAVLLYYYEDLSVTETAGLLGISVTAVKGRLHKARRQLHHALVARNIRSVAGGDLNGYRDKQTEREGAMIQENMVAVSIIDVLRQEETDHHIVILAEQNGRRLLSIWIGQYEGEAIAMRLLDKSTSRPMTFEFIANLLGAADVQLEQVSVSALKENTFYATVTLRNGERAQEVDARPSDAIALALRLDCPIFVAEDVMAGSNLQVPEHHDNTPTGKGLRKIAAIVEERGQQHEKEMEEWKAKEAIQQKDEEGARREKLLAALYGSNEPSNE